MKTKELVLIPSPGMGHLVSAIEVAKLLINRNEHLSITVLIMKLPFDTEVGSYTKSLSESSNSCIKFLELKKEESESSSQKSSFLGFVEFIDNHKNHVRDILAEISYSESCHLVGIVIDMFCTTMIDAANEIGVPSYTFYTSGAAVLGLVLHMQSLRDDFNEEVTDYENLDAEIAIPTYFNPVPTKVLLSILFDKEGGCRLFLDQAKRFKETKGILINTFLELESHAIEALSKDKTIPPVYPIGPTLNLKGSNGKNQDAEMIKKWLDFQPDSSVVFLCFGSRGYFDGTQVKEIAYALEKSGYRFLWSLRRPPAEGKMGFPGDYQNLEEVLPEGFLQRTENVGKVIGWAPQVAVLSHPAVGGFVSHCGWNSTLESVWCGVPMATWPLYAEQQVNAFLMVKDLELAVEIKMDFRKDFQNQSAEILSADIIEKGIRSLMDPENKIRKAAKDMKEKSRVALTEEGSSSSSLRCFLENM